MSHIRGFSLQYISIRFSVSYSIEIIITIKKMFPFLFSFFCFNLTNVFCSSPCSCRAVGGWRSVVIQHKGCSHSGVRERRGQDMAAHRTCCRLKKQKTCDLSYCITYWFTSSEVRIMGPSLAKIYELSYSKPFLKD